MLPSQSQGSTPTVTNAVPHGGGPQVLGAPSVMVASLSDANKIDGKAMNGDQAGVATQQAMIKSVPSKVKICKSATAAVIMSKGLQHMGSGAGAPAGMITAPSQTKVLVNG